MHSVILSYPPAVEMIRLSWAVGEGEGEARAADDVDGGGGVEPSGPGQRLGQTRSRNA